MTTSTASVPLTYGTWTSIGTAPLDAAVASSSYGAYVHLRESDSQPAAGAQPHYRLNASNPFAALRSGAQVWATVAGSDPTFIATLDVTTGIEIPGSSGGGGGGGSNGSVGSTGAAVPSSATAVGFQNAAGNLVLPTPSAGLPVADSGAAITGASIPAGGVGLTGWLSAIWSKVSGAALETGGNLASIAANVSTAANQTTANTSLASILTKATAIAASVAGTLTTALAAGSNIIGYAGSLNFQTAPVVPTIQAAAYASGNVIGGKQTVSVFRNTTQPSATLSQFLLGWAGTEAVAVTVYLFSRNPTNSTITDKAAFVLAAADAQYLVTPPFPLTAAAPVGATQTFAAQSLSLSAQNRDPSVTQNLYVVLVVGGAVTPAVGDLFFSISGVND